VDSIERDLKIGVGEMKWICLAQNEDNWFAFVDTVMNNWFQKWGREFFYYM